MTLIATLVAAFRRAVAALKRGTCPVGDAKSHTHPDHKHSHHTHPHSHPKPDSDPIR